MLAGSDSSRDHLCNSPGGCSSECKLFPGAAWTHLHAAGAKDLWTENRVFGGLLEHEPHCLEFAAPVLH